MAATADGGGYWLAAAQGGVFTYGDAHFRGSAGNTHLHAPIVGIAATPDGGGYWLAAADGGVFTYGDAHFRGSASPTPAGSVATAIAAPDRAQGYWLATAHTPPAPAPVTGFSGTAAASGTGTQAGRYLGTFVVTCYDLYGFTATGAPVGPSVVAVDPRVIPLGSRIYVDGAGSRVALDTGGGIKGNRLDIWAPSYSACAAWGVQARQVWLQG
jgi:3D (Asp-Asp-Asp) domain-containing protein